MRRYDLVNPFDMFHDLDKHLNLFVGNNSVKNFKQLNPKTYLDEKENFFHVWLDVPGIKKEDLDVELNDSKLTIKGERKARFENEEGEFESFGQFEKSFTLPEKANLDEIEVKHEHGVLDIIIPKVLKTNASRKLEIKDNHSLN